MTFRDPPCHHNREYCVCHSGCVSRDTTQAVTRTPDVARGRECVEMLLKEAILKEAARLDVDKYRNAETRAVANSLRALARQMGGN